MNQSRLKNMWNESILKAYWNSLSTLPKRATFVRMFLGALATGLFVYWLDADPMMIFSYSYIGSLGGFLYSIHKHTTKDETREAPKRALDSEDDRGNVAPISLLLIAVAAIVFQSLIYLEEYSQDSFIPSLETPDCSVYGPGIAEGIERIGCYIGAFFLTIANFILMIGSVAVFLGNAISFNIPGAPWYVRAMMTVFFAGSVGWALVAMFRGTRA